MIKTFRHRGLRELFEQGKTRRINAAMIKRARRRLDVLDRAKSLEQLNVPGFDFHPLRGHSPTRYSVHVNGPWCITFEWDDGNVYRVDFEQYH